MINVVQHSLHLPSEDTVSPVTAFLSTKNNSMSVFSATMPLQQTLTLWECKRLSALRLKKEFPPNFKYLNCYNSVADRSISLKFGTESE